tara:strand:- start:49 stop:960 length:912 start_codon:yes stop_codon:yes gene_type:complete
MKTLANQYKLIKEGKGHKGVFLKEAKAKFPNLLKNNSTFKEATTILKQKNIISENLVGMPMVGNPIERKKESYETAFANFIAEAEAKAEEKKVSKEVEEDASKNYDTADKKDPNNMIFGQIQMGYYYEMKQEKNADKTIEEIKDIVFKNLAKDPIYYTKNGQFGVDVGYTDDNVALGEPEEPKGEHKSSGYGKLKENKEPVNEIAIAGGLVTGGGFTSQNYMDFYGLNEADKDAEDAKATADELERAAKAAKEIGDTELLEDEAPMHIEKLMDAAEMAYDAGMDIDEILGMIEQHLGLKMGDF